MEKFVANRECSNVPSKNPKINKGFIWAQKSRAFPVFGHFKILGNKKGEMNWMVVMLIVALMAMFILIFIINGVMDKTSDPIGKLADDSTKKLEETTDDLFGQPILVVGQAYDFVSGEQEEE